MSLSATPSVSPSRMVNATLSLGDKQSTRQNHPIKIDPNTPLITLKALLALMEWVNFNTRRLPLQLATTVKNYIDAQLHRHPVPDINTKGYQDWEKCNAALKQLESDLPLPMPNTVWAPTALAPQTKQHSTPLYTVFNVEQPHHIRFKNKVLECKKSPLSDIAFNILSVSNDEKKTKESDNSVLTLAHLLIAHIDAHPGATIILSEKTCSYHAALNQYLHAYAELYKQVGAPLDFSLKWDTSAKALPRADESKVKAKIKEIMACQYLPDFATLQFEEPIIDEQHTLSPRSRF